jgi:outer membrane lipoprotein-sorting protein
MATSANGPVVSIRRSFIGGIHVEGSKALTRDDKVERHPYAANVGSRATAVSPRSNASLNCATESPKGDTTPTPVMAIRSLTNRTLPFRIVRLQRLRRDPGVAGAVIVCAALALAGLAGFAIGRLTARDLFDDLYERGQKQNAGLKTLTASFTETSTSALLAKPLVERGLVFVERPSRVALRYSEPDARVVVIDGDTMSLSWPLAKINTIKDIAAAQRRIQKYFVDSSPRELRSHFDVSATDAGERPAAYLITMIPKRKQILEGITKLELWIDRQTLLLSAMRMTFPGGETKTMTFAEVKVNVPIDQHVFAR